MSIFKKINNVKDLDLTCEFIYQNKNKMWVTLIRKTEDINASVVRVSIIGGIGNCGYLKVTSCKYPMTLNKSIWFTSTICKVNEDKFTKFKESL